jgi:hypothetical protein
MWFFVCFLGDFLPFGLFPLKKVVLSKIKLLHSIGTTLETIGNDFLSKTTNGSVTKRKD